MAGEARGKVNPVPVITIHYHRIIPTCQPCSSRDAFNFVGTLLLIAGTVRDIFFFPFPDLFTKQFSWGAGDGRDTQLSVSSQAPSSRSQRHWATRIWGQEESFPWPFSDISQHPLLPPQGSGILDLPVRPSWKGRCCLSPAPHPYLPGHSRGPAQAEAGWHLSALIIPMALL